MTPIAPPSPRKNHPADRSKAAKSESPAPPFPATRFLPHFEPHFSPSFAPTRKSNFLAIAAILTALFGCNGKLAAYSGSGDGSSGNPYEIANVADFQQLCHTPDDWYMSFVLTANLNLAGETLTPIGNESTRFTGVFDGNDKVISNAFINLPGSDHIGLFGHTGPHAQIRDLGVAEVNVTGNSYVGGLVGLNLYGTLTGCYATGQVSGAGREIGGLVGWNYVGSLTSCHATVAVTGTSYASDKGYIGGLVGNNGTETRVQFCYATGNVHGGWTVGGLVGNNDSNFLTSCYATGAVFGHGSQVGGLVGTNGFQGVITSCYATGPVTGTNYNSGGLVGGNYNRIIKCYAIGSVTGSYNTGGFMGRHSGGEVIACFWDTQACLPATVGVASGSSSGVTGMTTSQMKTSSTFTSAGWDFSHTDGDISDWTMPGAGYPQLIWGITVVVPGVVGLTQANAQTTLTRTELLVGISGVANDTVPAGEVISQSLASGLTVPGSTWIHLVVSLGVHYSGGSGTMADPYRISSIRDWQVLMSDSTDWDKAYRLTADINLSGVTLTPVGNLATMFTGVFDGNDKCIRGVVINSQPDDNNIGLFGYISYGCQIRNLGVEEINISGGYNATGGLVGRSDGGVLSACHTTGTVSGANDVGGLVGRTHDGVLNSCYTTCSVSGTGNYTGGLAGANVYGAVTCCYATGAVNGYYCAGGLLGFSSRYSTVTHCYATGLIGGPTFPAGLIGYDNGGTLSACFWDTDTSGMADGVGNVDPDPGEVTGKTTTAMTSLLTFTTAGWDFSATDGNPAVWAMPTSGYPRLVLQPRIDEPFKIIEFSGNPVSGLTLRWTCQVGYSYQVKYSETLAVDDWHEIGPVHTANGGESSLSFTDTAGAGVGRRFYVVVRSPL